MTDTAFSSDDFDKLLDDFITTQLSDLEDSFEDNFDKENNKKNDKNSNKDINDEDLIINEDLLEKNNFYNEYIQYSHDETTSLALEEKRLFEAIINLIKSSINCAKEADLDIDKFYIEINDILPRFNPKRTQNLTKNILQAWNLLIKSQPERLANLPLNASDEQILNYAEKTTNKNLMAALISYVETLIELDACEMDYEILELVGKKRGFLISGGEVNTERTATTLLEEFRSAKIGAISLETPKI